MGSIKIGFGIGVFLIALMNGWISSAVGFVFNGEERERQEKMLNKLDIHAVYLSMDDAELETMFRRDRMSRRLAVGKCAAFAKPERLEQFEDQEFVENVNRVCSIARSI